MERHDRRLLAFCPCGEFIQPNVFPSVLRALLSDPSPNLSRQRTDRLPWILFVSLINLNAYIERFMNSINAECLNKMIFFGENSLRRAVGAYLEHYHAERNHQGLGNHIIEPTDEVGRVDGPVECRERLGGLLRYYHRQAA